MLSFRNFSSKDLRKYAPYLVVFLLLAAVIIPVWADAPTQVSTFAELKAALAKGGNIKIMADIVDEEAGCLAITKDVTLDLNGHKLSKTNITGSDAGDQTRYFFNVYDGTFTINNSAAATGEINAAGASKTANPRAVAANVREENCNAKVIVNKGVKLSATNPTITGFFNKDNYENVKGQALGVYTPNDYKADAKKEPSSRTSSAEAIINDGATLNGIRQAIYVEGYGAKVTVNGGYITGCRQAVYNGGGGEVTVNGGVLSSTFRNALQNIKATMTVNGGTILGRSKNALSNSDDDSYIDPQSGETKHDYPECSAKGVAIINGGTFEGNVWSDYEGGNTLSIYNGKFTIDESKYLADGATGTWEGNWYVVRSYEQIDTAQEFLNAVAKGGNYRLGSDIEFTNYVEIFKDVTLDLNGHKLSRTNITAGDRGNPERFLIIVRNGTFTINNNSGTEGEIYAKASAADAAPRAIAAFPNTDGSHAKIIVYGWIMLKAENPSGYDKAASGIHGIGVYTPDSYMDDKYADPAQRKMSAEVVMNGGVAWGTKTAVTVEGYGAKLIVNQGEFHEGKHGIANYAGGEVIINYASINNCKNAVMTEKASTVINNGNFTGTSNAIALWCDSDNQDYPKCSHATETRVNDGAFTGAIDPDQGTILINGGKFTADPTAYKAEGATVTQEGNYYVVKLGDGCIGNLNQLLNALNNGGTYTLGADIEIPLNYDRLNSGNNLTLNMNGYTIHKTTNEANAGTRELMRVTDGTTTINGPGEIVCEAVENPQARPRCIAASSDSGRYPKLVLNGTNGELKIADKGGAMYNINEQSAGGSSAVGVWSNNTEGSITGTAKCEINGNVTVTSGRHTVLVEGPGCYATINGGTFNAPRNAISNNWGGVVTVNGGTFTGSNYAIINCKSTTTVNGGTFTGTKSVIYNDDESQEPTPFYPSSVITPTINITDGTFNGEIKNLTAKLPSKITISGGKYTANPTDYLDTGCKAEKQGEYYVVSQTESSSTYKVTSDKEGAIPGGTITAKIKVLFKDLQDMAVTGIQAVVNYATDIFELVSAEKSGISGATTPVTEVAGEVGFGLLSPTGVAFEEGAYYDFGTMTFRVKNGAAAGTQSNLSISDATYMLTDFVEKTATTTSAEIEVYQPVTAINITSQTGTTTMLVGNTLQLNADVLPVTAHSKDILWTSNDESIATVDANGLVTSQMISGKTANVTITAKALDGSNVTGNITLTVKRPKVTGMNFAQAAYELESDSATKNLYSELSVTPNTALKPATNEITWQSSNPNFTIDTNGVISLATATGAQQSTTVTAKYTNEDSQVITATCTVSSKPPKINLNLATKLEGRQSGGGTGTNVEKIEVWLYNSANKPLWNGSGTTDAQGKIRFEIDSSTVQAGQTVKLWIKGKLYLAKLLTQTVTLSGSDWNVTMPEKLKTADSNEDNKVNLTDFGILGNSFLKKKGVVGFDERADYNVDDKVNLTDFGFLGNNFLKKGDNKPQAAVTMLMTAAARKGSTDTAMEVLNTETAKVAEEALENSTATDEEQQEEEILYAVQNATGAELKAENPATSSANSSSDSNSGSSSGSGGCNAGYGALALMFAIPMLWRKKK